MLISLAVFLGIVQGLTEFLPVSSSGHLVIVEHFIAPYLGEIPDSLAFAVLVHCATLIVTLGYLNEDLKVLLTSVLSGGGDKAWAHKLILLVGVGIIPAGIIGLGFKDLIESSFSSVSAAANGLLITTIFLSIAQYLQGKDSSQTAVGDAPDRWQLPSINQAILIGLAQAVAIIPGVSRSGSTVACALILGLPTETALRFSFLISLPVILGATLLELETIFHLGSSNVYAFGFGFLASLLSGWFALSLLIKITLRAKLGYFAVYTGLVSLLLRLFSPQ